MNQEVQRIRNEQVRATMTAGLDDISVRCVDRRREFSC